MNSMLKLVLNIVLFGAVLFMVPEVAHKVIVSFLLLIISVVNFYDGLKR